MQLAREPLSVEAPAAERDRHYRAVLESVWALLEDEDDHIAALSTVACELHHAFTYFDWTGFYRQVRPGLLVVGPYQGGHGCLRIEVPHGVCGKAVESARTQLVDDVNALEGHIACSTTTRSEIVVPVVSTDGRVVAVLDVDSDQPAAFGAIDREHLETLCRELGRRFP